jgi:hypothetical protein
MSEPQSLNHKTGAALFAGGLAAILASACCLGRWFDRLGVQRGMDRQPDGAGTLSPDLHRRSAGRAVFRLAAHLPPGASLQTG